MTGKRTRNYLRTVDLTAPVFKKTGGNLKFSHQCPIGEHLVFYNLSSSSSSSFIELGQVGVKSSAFGILQTEWL